MKFYLKNIIKLKSVLKINVNNKSKKENSKFIEWLLEKV